MLGSIRCKHQVHKPLLGASTIRRDWVRGHFRIGVLFVVMATVQLAGAADTSDPSWRLEPLDASVPLAAPTAIHLSNTYGEIHVRPSPELVVEALAMSQRHADDPRRFEIATRRGGDGLHLDVHSSELAGEAADSWRKRRIDLTVFVPRDAPLTVETLHGKVQVRGMDADVSASSTSGELIIATHGKLTAQSDYGNIRAELLAAASDATHSVETVTGTIEIHLPWQSGVEATIITRGVIASDYSLEMSWPDHTRAKTGVISFRRNAPGHSLRLRSERGDVRVLRRLGIDASRVPSENTP